MATWRGKWRRKLTDLSGGVANVLAIMLGLNIVFAGAWDVYAFLLLSPTETVSYAAWKLSQAFPPLVLVLGMILGHVLWPLHVSSGPENLPK